MNSLLEKVSEYVISQYSQPAWNTFDYHNLFHTLHVVKESEKLAQMSNLPPKDTDVLLIAAWFHDLGYINGVENHEDTSCKIARKFLKKQKAPKSLIEEVCSLIQATRTGFERYQSIFQKIIRDADLSNAGRKKFRKWSEALRKEWEEKTGKSYSDIEWYELQTLYLENLEYLSEAGKKRYSNRKMKNLKKYKSRLKKQLKSNNLPSI